MVVNCFNEVKLNFGKAAIDRSHRIGEEYKDDVTNKMVRPIIVKFRSWGERTAFYKARPRLFSNGIKKPGTLPFRVSLDLTKRRYDLLKHAREVIKSNPNFLYAFADVNCSLVIKDKNNKHHYFNTKDDLAKILIKF